MQGKHSQEEQLAALIMIQGVLLSLLQEKIPKLRSRIEEQLEVSKKIVSSQGEEPHKSDVLNSIDCAQQMIAAALPVLQ